MKKVLLLLSILLVLPGVFAAAIDLQPDAVYETNTVDFNVSVNNFLGKDVIVDILLDTDDIEVMSVQDFIGWENDFDSNEVHWFNGTIENNVLSSLFIFSSTLPLVDNDQDQELQATITYADSSTEDFILRVEVLNDDTPPAVNSYSPQDYARANIADQDIIVNVTDPETGVDEVLYEYGPCSGNTSAIALECNEGICTGNADFSGFDEGDTACFTITAKNNAGEIETIEGTLEFDGTAPEVTLISPTGGSYAGPGSTFSFRAADNAASELDCDVFIDDELVHSAVVANDSEEQFALNVSSLEEAMHDWEVSCTDAVGLNDIAADQFSYDQTPPTITLNSPANSSLIASTTINVSVDDNIGVNTVSYNLPEDTSTWPEGENIFTVNASDLANNVASAEFTFYVDRTPPSIAVISPPNNSTFDYNAVFTFNVSDTYDYELECTLDTNVNASATENISGVADISLILPLGSFTWQLTCVDDAGNTASTASYTANAIDTTGPIIDLEDVRYVVRGTDLAVSANIIDASGVASATASFEGSTINLSSSGDDYTGAFATDSNASLGEYSYSVSSLDTNSYSSTLTDTFEIIEGYVITLDLPNSVRPGATVSASGTIEQDNGTIPSGNVTMEYNNESVSVAIVNGTFSHSFTAPDSTGTYTVTVEYETDRFVYALEDTYRVANPQNTGSSGGSSGGGGYEGYELNTQGVDYQAPPVQESSGGQNLEEDTEASASELVTEDPEPEPTEPTVELPEEEPRTPSGVGQATGVLDILGRAVKWMALLLALVALILGLYFATRNLKKPKSGGKINWDGYFD